RPTLRPCPRRRLRQLAPGRGRRRPQPLRRPRPRPTAPAARRAVPERGSARAIASRSARRRARSWAGGYRGDNRIAGLARDPLKRASRLDGLALERGRAARAAPLLQVLLVVVLGRVERLCRLDHRDDGLAIVRLLLRLRSRRDLLLLGIVEEDHRAVLVADVPALAVELGRVVLGPEDLEQLLVRDLLRVVGDLDDLRVAGRVGADVLVGRVLERAALVADLCPGYAVELAERGLHAPEAAGAERCLLLHYSSSSFNAAELMQ